MKTGLLVLESVLDVVTGLPVLDSVPHVLDSVADVETVSSGLEQVGDDDPNAAKGYTEIIGSTEEIW